MNVFDKHNKEIMAYFSDWIEHKDNKTNFTIEDFPYETGVVEEVTYSHCGLCISVNRCWFKNEKNKKPSEILHPNCHCRQNEIERPKKIDVIITQGKIEYLFTKKLGWIEYCGYTLDDKDDFIKLLINLVKEAYLLGNYYKEAHTVYGFKINVKLNVPGKNNKKGYNFPLESNYMVFPNGKLKMNTPIGGWQK